MGLKLRTRLAAGALAVLATVPLGARPASADLGTIAAVVKAAYTLYKEYIADSLTLEEATRQIIGAIDSAKTEILGRIDQVAAADVRACAVASMIDFTDIQAMSPDTLQAFARDSTGCLTRAESLVGTLSDKSAIDTIGLALNAVGPIALTARARAGFETASTLSTATAANQRVVTALEPVCVDQLVREPAPVKPIVEEFYTCTAFNGTVASDSRSVSPRPGPPLNYEAIKDQATANTSRALAKAVLPVLQS